MDALQDLPMAWLHHMSTKLTAQSAACLRSTCKLLREVIDATWEPDDQPVAPHRRSVPLTLEQVQAQLPQAQPRPPQHGLESYGWDDSWDDEKFFFKFERPDQGGCNPFWLEVFGPALTRLTANQALNLLKGKPLLGFADVGGRCVLWDLDKHSTGIQRLNALDEMTFPAPWWHRWTSEVQWPPQAPTGRAPAVDGSGSGSSESYDMPWRAGGGRGECGWKYGEEIIVGQWRRPSEVSRLWAESNPAWSPYREGSNKEESWHDLVVSTEDSRLLVTTDSSCREATGEEVQQSVASDSPDDGERFDVYLTCGGCRIYVFLGPVEPRLTGRPKATPGATLLKTLAMALMHPLILLAVTTAASQVVQVQ